MSYSHYKCTNVNYYDGVCYEWFNFNGLYGMNYLQFYFCVMGI